MTTIPDEFSARQGRHYPYSQPGDWVLLADVSQGAKLLYWALMAHTSAGREWKCWPKQAALGAMIGDVSERSVRRWTKQLERVGAVDVEEVRDPDRKTRRLIYTVHQTPPDDYQGHDGLATWYRGLYQVERSDAAVSLASTGNHRTPVSGGSEQTTGLWCPVVTGHQSPHTTGHPCPGNKTYEQDVPNNTPPSPSESSPVDERNDEGVCVDQARKILGDSIPAGITRRMNAGQRGEVLALVVDCLNAGHEPAAIRDRLTGAANTATIDVHGAITRRIAEMPDEPAEKIPANIPTPKKCWSGCVNGRMVCSTDCAPTCNALHEPRGETCRQCNREERR